jgi:anti-sigma regulatory factor (Ser/Thr protein kinase)
MCSGAQVTEGEMPLTAAEVLDGRVTATWPLCSYLELGALPSAVPCARLHATQVLWEWGLAGMSESIELVVSELVTNAIQASRGRAWPPVVRLWLVSDKSRVLVLVWDADSMRPVRIHPDEGAEAGRGLMLVESISDRWNSFRPAGHEGKVVWAEVSAAARS